MKKETQLGKKKKNPNARDKTFLWLKEKNTTTTFSLQEIILSAKKHQETQPKHLIKPRNRFQKNAYKGYHVFTLL